MSRIPQGDQETGINFLRSDSYATVSTSDRTMWTLLSARGWEFTPDPAGEYRNYRVPVKAITIRSKSSVEATRPRSAAQIEATEKLLRFQSPGDKI